MNTYWKRHPRNFANEFTIGIASTKEHAEQYAAEGFDRIDRDYALRLLSRHASNGEQLYRTVTIDGDPIDIAANLVAHNIRAGRDVWSEL